MSLESSHSPLHILLNPVRLQQSSSSFYDDHGMINPEFLLLLKELILLYPLAAVKEVVEELHGLIPLPLPVDMEALNQCQWVHIDGIYYQISLTKRQWTPLELLRNSEISEVSFGLHLCFFSFF